MGWAVELGTLGQEITTGLETRLHERQGRHATVSRFLSAAQASREEGFRALHQQMAQDRRERNREVARMKQNAKATLSGFHQERMQAHTQWCGLGKSLTRKRAVGN